MFRNGMLENSFYMPSIKKKKYGKNRKRTKYRARQIQEINTGNRIKTIIHEI